MLSFYAYYVKKKTHKIQNLTLFVILKCFQLCICFWYALYIILFLISYCTWCVVGEMWLEWLFPNLMLWMLNIAVVAAVLTRIMVYGEPVTKPMSRASVEFWRHRKQSDVDLARVSYYKMFSLIHSCFDLKLK